MKFTNNYNLPEGVYNAIVNHDYDKGTCDYSVSELLMPPQMRRLFQLYHNDIVIDVSANIWSLFGTSVHYILDRDSNLVSVEQVLRFREQQLADIKTLLDDLDAGAIKPGKSVGEMTRDIIARIPPVDAMAQRIIKEVRYYLTVGGIIIGGKPDWYDKESNKVEDYKVTSTWKVMHGDVADWEAQQNVYRYVLEDNGYPVKTLQINAILKDWKGFQRRQEGYPPVPFKAVELKVWNSLDTLTYIIERLRLHLEAGQLEDAKLLSEQFPCSVKDRWGKEEYAVKKPGNKNASAKFDTIDDAQKYINEHPDSTYNIEDRTENKRCDEFCNVAKFCHQYASYGRKVIDTPAIIDLPSENLTLEEVKARDTSNYSTEQLTAHFNLMAKLAKKKVVAEPVANIEQPKSLELPPEKVDSVLSSTDALLDDIKTSLPEPPPAKEESIDDVLEGLGL
jgi:hypothetical protein